MLNKKRFLLPLLLGISMFCKTYAQNNVADSLLTTAINKNIQTYILNQGSNLKLYNGIEYVFLYRTVSGFPFFLTGTFDKNSIVYDGTTYWNVPLAYDIVSDQVATITPDNNYIQLIPEKITAFTINNHQFIRLSATEVANTPLAPGFYDATITPAAALLVKHVKVVRHSSKPEEPDRFNEYNNYYIKLGSTFYAVKSSKALLNILRDKSNEIRSYMHQNSLNFKKNPEQTLIKVIEYYAQLKK